MGFSDRLRAWLKGESKQRRATSASMGHASREATGELERFARSRIGVEAYLEPKTTLYATTVLLVADDGEYLRRPVQDRDQAASLCKDLNIPLYDARKVGYPRRMRDYDQGKRPRRVELSELPPWPGDEAEVADPDGPPPPPPVDRADEQLQDEPAPSPPSDAEPSNDPAPSPPSDAEPSNDPAPEPPDGTGGTDEPDDPADPLGSDDPR